MKDNLCCCVCLKEEPFSNNPIISCDGRNCNTIVHKNCYGIHQIPDGAWFCQKCISQERSARVRCELCPSREGALKHTNKGGWCHIICALFIPGVEFLDAERLETISIDKVASDKMNKICSICEKNNRLDRASVGACIQCVKAGCKTLFHVTCAQSMGLLSETVSSKEGVRYIGFCANHKHKTKHRDFMIRRSSSLNSSGGSSSKYEKQKLLLRQTPPKLEKSDDDCVTTTTNTTTPQHDMSSETERGSEENRTSGLLHISTASSSSTGGGGGGGGINFSSSSLSTSLEEDSCYERLAPQIVDMPLQQHPNARLDPPESSRPSQPVSTPSSATAPLVSQEPPNITASSVSPPHMEPPPASVPAPQPPPPPSLAPAATKEETVSRPRPVLKRSVVANSNIPAKKERVVKKEKKTIVPSTSASDIKNKKPRIKSLPKSTNCTDFNPPSVPHQTHSSTTHSSTSLPNRPRSFLSQVSSIIPGAVSSGLPLNPTSSTSTPKPLSSGPTGNTSCQSMEELLEWQWDQAGSLLMQQADASSDIASLLSCLHDLKTENEQLVSKQLRLVQRRDHLKAVNAKLQLQLHTKQVQQPSTSTKPPTQPLSRPAIVPTVSKKSSQILLTNGPSDQSGNSSGIGPANKIVSAWPASSLSVHHHPATITTASASVSSLLSQTDLVTFLNNQLHSQLASVNTKTPTPPLLQQQQQPQSQHQQTNMELLYHAIQQKKQQQQQRPQTTQFQVPQSSLLPVYQQIAAHLGSASSGATGPTGISMSFLPTAAASQMNATPVLPAAAARPRFPAPKMDPSPGSSQAPENPTK